MRNNGRVTDTEYRARLAGRVVAIDPAGRVLLFYYQDPPPKGEHWATPGGGLEDGEGFYAAACRELAEETGWTDVPVAPQEVLLDVNVQFSGYFQAVGSCNRFRARGHFRYSLVCAQGAARGNFGVGENRAAF